MSGVVNGSGRTLATRERTEKNDPAAINSAKHMRHKCRASRGAPRKAPDRSMRKSTSGGQGRHSREKEEHEKRDAGNGAVGTSERLEPQTDLEERERDHLQ